MLTDDAISDLFQGDPVVNYIAHKPRNHNTTFMKMDPLTHAWCVELAHLLTVVRHASDEDKAIMDGWCTIPDSRGAQQDWQAYAEGLLEKIQEADWSVAQGRQVKVLLSRLKLGGRILNSAGKIAFKEHKS